MGIEINSQATCFHSAKMYRRSRGKHCAVCDTNFLCAFQNPSNYITSLLWTNAI
jgi:hypothetical protein